jgi:glutamine synthetase
MTDPIGTDPADKNPAERDLERRSSGPAASPWLIIGLILMLGAVAYVISATVMG